MPINKRFEIINILESIILKEDLETFIKKSKRSLTPQENDDFIRNWYKNSSTFTRMWLNYLSDERLLEILERKMANQNINKDLMGLNSRI